MAAATLGAVDVRGAFNVERLLLLVLITLVATIHCPTRHQRNGEDRRIRDQVQSFGVLSAPGLAGCGGRARLASMPHACCDRGRLW
jgi:hypothetical protein